MRTTQATRAVDRLKNRSGNPHYAAVGMPGGLFYLADRSSGEMQKLCKPLPLDEFVVFVNALAPAQPAKTSKFDQALETQIKNSRR